MQTTGLSRIEGLVARTPAFAWRYELAFPSVGIRYTYIPKNGCSTLKLSLGRREGWLQEGDDPHAIRPRDRLVGQLKTRRADVRFVVLRDPMQRLASAFLDRFSKPVDRATDALVRQGLLGPCQRIEDVTFAQFTDFLCRLRSSEMDPHWRPQVDFLYGSYTHYFRFEQFSRCLQMLRDREIPVVQHRPHATSAYRPMGSFAGRTTVKELRRLRTEERISPRYAELSDAGLVAAVRHLYAADYELMDRVVYA